MITTSRAKARKGRGAEQREERKAKWESSRYTGRRLHELMNPPRRRNERGGTQRRKWGDGEVEEESRTNGGVGSERVRMEEEEMDGDEREKVLEKTKKGGGVKKKDVKAEVTRKGRRGAVLATERGCGEAEIESSSEESP